MSFEDWLARGWLTRHRAGREEIRRLLAGLFMTIPDHVQDAQ